MTLKSHKTIFIVWISFKMNQEAEGPETLFHIRSNLLCQCVFSFLFALQCIFHCMRTCVAWERHCLSGMATVTKAGLVLQTINLGHRRTTIQVGIKYSMEGYIYIYIYAFSRRFYPKRLNSGYTCVVSMCSLGIEPTAFCAAKTQCSNHWATGTEYIQDFLINMVGNSINLEVSLQITMQREKPHATLVTIAEW